MPKYMLRYRLADPALTLTDSISILHHATARERRSRLQRLKVSMPVFQRPHQAAHDRDDPWNLDSQYSCWIAFSAKYACVKDAKQIMDE